jgi:hypothetical protein
MELDGDEKRNNNNANLSDIETISERPYSHEVGHGRTGDPIRSWCGSDGRTGGTINKSLPWDGYIVSR